MREILILSVMKKSRTAVLSDDYENKWEEKQMDKQQ
jgi:hypothetical protein